MLNKTDLLLEQLNENVKVDPSKPNDAKRRRGTRRITEARQKANPDPEPSVPIPRKFTGRPIGFWGDAEDRRILREFSLILFQAGFKASESLAIRAALRLVHHEQRASELVEQARTVLEKDGRRLRHNKETNDK